MLVPKKFPKPDGGTAAHQQDVHMQPFKCLRSEPNLLVQFSTGRTWQSAEVGEPMLSSSAVDGKNGLLPKVCQQHIVREAFAKLRH